MPEFIKFWWECVKAGSTGSFGIFGFVETLSALVWAALKFFGKHQSPWEEKVKMAALYLFIGSFLVATVFVSPFVQYKDSEKLKNVAIGETLVWSNRTEKAESKASASNLRKLEQDKEIERKKIAALEDSSIRRDSMILAMVTNHNPMRAVAETIAAMPPITNIGKPFNLADSLLEIRDQRLRQEAQTTISKMNSEDAYMVSLTNGFPAFDYAIKTLKHYLSEVNDKVLLEYNGLPMVAENQITNFASIMVDGHPTWEFNIFLWKRSPIIELIVSNRKEITRPPGHYGMGGNDRFFSLFVNGGRMSCSVRSYGKPVISDQFSSEDYQEHISHVLGLMIAAEYEEHPITNSIGKILANP